LILLLFVMLGIGAYIFWNNLPGEQVQFNSYNINYVPESSHGGQFYPNMRYREKRISYTIEDACGEKKREDVLKAFELLDEKTVLSFYPSASGEIRIFCSEIAPEPAERGHFVAGEGGPSQVINTSLYSVIFSGKVSLYRADSCDNPQVATHEILHALGFDHNGNKESIMFPTTGCNQILDQYIIDKINSLYSADTLPDLAIEKVDANATGRYLNFEIVVINLGLMDSKDSNLKLYTNSEEIKEFDLQSIEIGTRKVLTVQNVKIPANAQKVNFIVESSEKELSKENNDAEVQVLNNN